MPEGLFFPVETDRLILKFVWKYEGLEKSKQLKIFGGFIPPDFRLRIKPH